MKKMNFLFGSGISLSANLPNVSSITNDLLTNSEIFNYPNDPSQEEIKYYRKFLKKLSNYCIALNLNNTYEDLYYLTKSIEDTLPLGKYADFFVNFFREKIKYDLPTLIDEKTLKIHDNNLDFCLEQFIIHLNWYIENFVANKLQHADNLEHINRFINMLLKEENFNYDFFTLNHDILLETSLKKKNDVDPNTGFGKNNIFSIDNFKNPSHRFNILKLHGSINWNRKRDYNGKDYIFTIDPANPIYDQLDPSNTIVIGTFNKFKLYSYGIFYDLFHEFKSRLSQMNLLFVCGYGFRDEGINYTILEWLLKNDVNKLIIFHKDKDSLIGNANVSVGWEWKKCINSKQIIFKQKYFEDIEWKDMNELIKIYKS
ncbi:MAG: SIR2 family protein [Candidatus Cloacimonetes bacterium]|nr:SIR2 family protein [Candidatus Cloacimonadota bacterium]